jgi:hypothetical protein
MPGETLPEYQKSFSISARQRTKRSNRSRSDLKAVSLPFSVARLMVQVDKIQPHLALRYVSKINESELLRQFRMYVEAETELSVAGPNPRAVNESSTRFSRPQRRRQADGTQLRSREGEAR